MTPPVLPAGPWHRVAHQVGLLADDGTPGVTIFAEMTALAVRTGAINLGQGFPDTDGPPQILKAAVTAIRGGRNQYPPGRGTPELRQAVAAHQSRFYDLDVDPDREVLVTAGATEAIAATILALTGPGDEVIVLEPYFDSYAACIALSGATRVAVPLRFPDYALDPVALAAAFTPRTRLLLLNTPHNPTGRVLTDDELGEIARLVVGHDVLVVTDEVYEHLVFTGHRHRPPATYPGLADRTISISSAGKTFSVTGWKIGWLTAPAALVDAVTTVKQFLTYVSGGPLQPAVAVGLGLPDDVYADVAARLEAGRDLLVSGLVDAGFTVSRSAGTYFVVADAAPLGFEDGLDLCRHLPALCGVVAVPVRVFHDNLESAEAARSLVRFAVCKRTDVLEEACRRLLTLRYRRT